ncbi:MAG: helix-turn-helix transcriptional regulator [Bacteroidia bacterium]|nr:helix-turn-helix transcriptional regulator [Bacteroidia bacterium]
MENSPFVTEILHIKSMVCNCCIRIIREEFEKASVFINSIRLGIVVVTYNSSFITIEKIAEILKKNGFELIKGKEEQLVEQIKQAVIELIHFSNNVDSIIRKSDYIVEKLGYTYQHLSKVFSKFEPVTLERFIILNKIERIKELIDGREFTLSEIAYMMDYCSVQHLSMQFKNITGLSVSEYKKSDKSIKKPLDNLAYSHNE